MIDSMRRQHLDARFQAYDAANPEVFRLFVTFAERAHEAKASRVGAKAIAERIRWECAVETRGESVKLNNDYVSRYARKVAAARPDLAHLFETRRLKA